MPQSEGDTKSYKGTHCVQVDRDVEAMGSLGDRKRASQATRPAMYKNSERLTPLFVPLSAPRPMFDKGRGSRSRREALRQSMEEYKSKNKGLVLAEEEAASRIFRHAFASAANTRSYTELAAL